MRVLICNKFYYRRGGACVYSMNLEQLLRRHGHQVAFFAMDHPSTADTPWRQYFPTEVNMDSLARKWRFFVRCLGDRQTISRFQAILDAFQPDLVHMNNIHSQLSPVLAQIAHQRGCKVVWTVHDYKLLCPRYDCLRRGKTPCQACFTDKRNVLRYVCMKNSLPVSVAAYLEAIKWNRERMEACTDAFICPSRFLLSKMLEGGFPPDKMHYLCNFMDTEKFSRTDYLDRADYYCYVGRLSGEKGIRTLVETAAKLPYKLIVVGDGPLQASLPQAPNIDYVGHKQWEEIKEIVSRARFLVLPSEWYENNPLSVIEALCLGTPVLGARIGGIPELIQEPENGLTFESGNAASLAAAIGQMFNARFDYAHLAVESLARFSDEPYYAQLMDIYTQTGL